MAIFKIGWRDGSEISVANLQPVVSGASRNFRFAAFLEARRKKSIFESNRESL